MTLTSEQSDILNHFISTPGITAITAVSGAGKTSTLVEIAKRFPHKRGLMLAYNNSVATSSRKKFPSTVDCRTTHSLAYQAVVKQFRLFVGAFTYKSITHKISYEHKVAIINTIKEFCLSKYTDFDLFASETHVPDSISKLSVHYLSLMQSGKIECTHDFYLKLFHIYLADGTLSYPDFDFIMLDECGDLNPVTIEIFHLLPSQRKLAVGDPFQNIYSFNHTVNYFAQLPSDATLMPMSQSFRVPKFIATLVEKFCQKYLDPSMQFKGVDVTDRSISTRAYLTRTNAALIAEMIRCDDEGIPYNLLRDPKEIFRIPLMLCGLKYQGYITVPEYSHIQADVDEWYESDTLKSEFKSALAYLASLYSEEDMQLRQAIRLLLKYKAPRIIETFKKASSHVGTHHPYTLSTVHAAKGMEWDSVTVATDLNDTTQLTKDFIKENPQMLEDLPQERIDTLNLYYVCVTRCKKELHNAIHL